MKSLFGNTYEHKEFIKSKGGKWNVKLKCWDVPATVYDEICKLCQTSSTSLKGYVYTGRKFECHDCGDDVYPGTECWETGLKH